MAKGQLGLRAAPSRPHPGGQSEEKQKNRFWRRSSLTTTRAATLESSHFAGKGRTGSPSLEYLSEMRQAKTKILRCCWTRASLSLKHIDLCDDTLNLVLSTLSTASGITVLPSMSSTNGINEADIVVGGENVPARTLLLETLGTANNHRVIHWELDRYIVQILTGIFSRSLRAKSEKADAG